MVSAERKTASGEICNNVKRVAQEQKRTHGSQHDEVARIQAVTQQVLGNPDVMAPERLEGPELLVKPGYLSVREFGSQIAKSGLYRTKFLENCNANRFSELNFKHQHGRAPRTWPRCGRYTIDYARTSDLVRNAPFSPMGDTIRRVSRMGGKVVGFSVSTGVRGSDGEAGPTSPTAPRRAPPTAADRLDRLVPDRAPS